MLDRLELLLIQITELEQSRDAVLKDENPDRAAGMIQQLAELLGVGVQSATVLVREGFVRKFANGKALGSYAGLTATPYSSGGTEREQGIGKAGNARLRTVMVELAWLWQRYQPDSAQVSWFRERISGTGRRMRKVMVVALARKLLIALWRFATQGVVPEVKQAFRPSSPPPRPLPDGIAAHTDAYHEGIKAGMAGNRGPFPMNTPKDLAFYRGWRAAR